MNATESDFILTPNQGTPSAVIPEATTSDSDALFEAAIKAASDVADADEPVSESAPAPAPAQAQAPAPSEDPKPDPVPEPAKAPDRIAPTLLKLMEREAALVERENKYKAAEQDILVLRDHISQYETAQRKFQYDPVGFIRALAPDVDLADLAKSLWYEKLGDGAPADYRATKEARAAKSTVEELRAEFDHKIEAERQRWAEDNQRKEAETAYNQYVGALGAFAKQAPDEYPLVKSFAASDPDRVQRGLLKIAQKHAQATGGEVLSPAECAGRLNKELEGLRAALGVTSTPAPSAPAPTKNEAQPVSTLRNKHTSVQPNRTLPDPADEEAKFQAALEAVRSISDR